MSKRIPSSERWSLLLFFFAEVVQVEDTVAFEASPLDTYVLQICLGEHSRWQHGPPTVAKV